MLNQCLCLFILLFSVGFFRLAFLPVDIVTKWMSVFGLLLCFAVFFLPFRRTNNNNLVKANFTYPIGFMMLAVFLSMLPCYFDWGQSFKITFVAQRGTYFLILYFVLHKLSLTKEQFLQVLTVFAAMYLIVFAAQHLMWPRPVVYLKYMLDDTQVFDPERDRHFGLPGIRIVLLFFYVKLCDFIKAYDKKALIWLGVLFVHFIIVQTRSFIFPIIATTTFAVWINNRGGRKIYVQVAYILGVLIILLFVGNTIYSLIEESQEQLTEPGYVRYRSIQFYVTEFPKSIMGYVLGNGHDSSHSAYGQFVHKFLWPGEEGGLHLSDIGLIGDYVRMGIIFISSLLVILFRILLSKSSSKACKCYALHILIIPTIFCFSQGSQVVTLCLLCYMADLYLSEAIIRKSTI